VAGVFHGGMAFPYLTPSLGPGSLNLFLGSEPGFSDSTVWYKPCFSDPATVDLALKPDNPYWQWTLAATREYVAKADGKFLVGLPDIIEGLDILAGLFGTEELLMFLVDCPDEVHRLLDQLDALYWQAFDPLYELVKDERGGNAFIAFQIWGPGRTLKTQCDFAAMISPAMFAEFVCPYMERQCRRADFSLYHLDGPDCICHLDVLLSEVPSLDALQWVPGAGNPHPACADPAWWDVIWRPVYEAGKRAHVLGNPPELVKPFVKEFGWTGTYMGTGCESETAARRLIDEAATW
jgi:5-methyltetrahydrofolate--homocysteine methyltransferase